MENNFYYAGGSDNGRVYFGTDIQINGGISTLKDGMEMSWDNFATLVSAEKGTSIERAKAHHNRSDDANKSSITIPKELSTMIQSIPLK